MEKYVKYYYLHIELTTTSRKFIYISILEVIMAGRYKITSNSTRNLSISHYKDGKSIRTVGKHLKESHRTVFAVIRRFKLRGLLKMH